MIGVKFVAERAEQATRARSPSQDDTHIFSDTEREIMTKERTQNKKQEQSVKKFQEGIIIRFVCLLQ